MITEFLGEVRGYTVGDDDLIHLALDEVNHSENAIFHVRQMQQDFDPRSGRHGFGSKDTPCKVRPGFASYKFALTRDEARNITQGSRVRVRLDFYHVRKVIFGKNRWAPIPEVRYDFISIQPESDSRLADSKAESASASGSGNHGKSGGK